MPSSHDSWSMISQGKLEKREVSGEGFESNDISSWLESTPTPDKIVDMPSKNETWLQCSHRTRSQSDIESMSENSIEELEELKPISAMDNVEESIRNAIETERRRLGEDIANLTLERHRTQTMVENCKILRQKQMQESEKLKGALEKQCKQAAEEKANLIKEHSRERQTYRAREEALCIQAQKMTSQLLRMHAQESMLLKDTLERECLRAAEEITRWAKKHEEALKGSLERDELIQKQVQRFIELRNTIIAERTGSAEQIAALRTALNGAQNDRLKQEELFKVRELEAQGLKETLEAEQKRSSVHISALIRERDGARKAFVELTSFVDHQNKTVATWKDCYDQAKTEAAQKKEEFQRSLESVQELVKRHEARDARRRAKELVQDQRIEELEGELSQARQQRDRDAAVVPRLHQDASAEMAFTKELKEDDNAEKTTSLPPALPAPHSSSATEPGSLKMRVKSCLKKRKEAVIPEENNFETTTDTTATEVVTKQASLIKERLEKTASAPSLPAPLPLTINLYPGSGLASNRLPENLANRF